jgi:hypothetical protein
VKLVSKFAFNFNLRRYIEDLAEVVDDVALKKSLWEGSAEWEGYVQG